MTPHPHLGPAPGSRSAMARSRLGLAVLLTASLSLHAAPALGQAGNFDSFGQLAAPAPSPDAPTVGAVAAGSAEEFGSVPTDHVSLTNLAPIFLPFFNNGPVFGLPGTDTGDFWHRTQLTGDWGGWRTKLARHGFFLDLYTTSAWQRMLSGGLESNDWFVQNTQLSLNLDTGRAGLWSGGLFHFTIQSRYGNSPAKTFTSGTSTPVYVGLIEPDPVKSSAVLPSEYFLVQALTEHTSVMLGKISDVFIPDQTLFGNSFRFYFANFAFNKNPITANFYNPTAWAALGIIAPSKSFAIAGGVLDPNSHSQTFAARAFTGVNLYLTAVASWSLGGLPGQFSPAYNWSNQSQLNLADPFGQLSPTQVPQAVGVLLGSPETAGLPINESQQSWFLIGNVSQYLWLFEDPAGVKEKVRTGQQLRGLGLFARGGYAPPATNTIATDASVAAFLRGPFDVRSNDSFGIGWYWNGISSDLKRQVSTLTGGLGRVKNEQGFELFYDFALTPAIRIIPGWQHIWNPFAAQVAARKDHDDIFLLRGTFVF